MTGRDIHSGLENQSFRNTRLREAMEEYLPGFLYGNFFVLSGHFDEERFLEALEEVKRRGWLNEAVRVLDQVGTEMSYVGYKVEVPNDHEHPFDMRVKKIRDNIGGVSVYFSRRSSDAKVRYGAFLDRLLKKEDSEV